VGARNHAFALTPGWNQVSFEWAMMEVSHSRQITLL